MPEARFGAWRRHAVSLSWIGLAGAAVSGASTAQTLHPFAPPVVVPAFSLTAAAAVADVDRDGSPDVITPSFFGGTLVCSLDEDGNCLACNGNGSASTPIAASTTLPIVIAVAAGRIDQDATEDLITVTSCGTAHFHRNLGSTRLGCANFAPDDLVDDFAASFPTSAPFITYWFPTATVLDFDGDGAADVLLGGGPLDRWSAATCPGFVALYRGDGLGGFQVLRCTLPGNVIDVEPVDLDRDGALDHFAVLVEVGSLGAFGFEIVHLALVNGALVATGQPQVLPGCHYTDLAFADTIGDTNLDYVLAQTVPNSGSPFAQVICFQGDGLGTVNTSSWCTFALPAGSLQMNDFVAAIAVGDWNRDGHADLAVLRGYVQPQPAYSTSAPTFGQSELLLAMGPNLAYATFETVALPGHHSFAAIGSSMFALVPLPSAPGYLRTIDLRRDGSPDLMVSGLYAPGSAAPTRVATLVNTTPASPTDACFSKCGEATGGNPAHRARIGFDGGRPCPGNGQFACTLLNVQGGCLVGLMWGPVGVANLCAPYGYQVNLAPMLYATATLAQGSQPGDGFVSFPLPIPASTALVGDAGWFQWNYYDHVTGALGGTQATGVRIGQ